MNDSPASILYDTDGYKLPVKDGQAVNAFTPGLVIAGVDESGNTQFLRLNTSGRLEVIPGTGRVLIGKYYGSTGFITGAASTQSLATLENPTGSGKTIYLRKVAVHGVTSSTSTTAYFYLLKRTTALPTGGTTITSDKRDTTEAAASGIIRQSPTAAFATGVLWATSPGTQSNRGTYLPAATESLIASFDGDEIVIRAGEAVGVQAGVNSNNWVHFVNFNWVEA